MRKWTTRRNVVFALPPWSDYVEGPDKHQKEETRHQDTVLNKIENYIKYIYFSNYSITIWTLYFDQIWSLQIHFIYIFPENLVSISTFFHFHKYGCALICIRLWEFRQISLNITNLCLYNCTCFMVSPLVPDFWRLICSYFQLRSKYILKRINTQVYKDLGTICPWDSLSKER